MKYRITSIKARILIICLAMVTVPMTILGVLSYNSFKKEAFEKNETDLGLITNGWKVAVNSYIQQLDRYLKREEAMVEQKLGAMTEAICKMFELEYETMQENPDRKHNIQTIFREIAEIKIARSGYLFICQPDGKYIVSKNREHDSRNIFDFVHPDDKENFKQTFNTAVQSYEGAMLSCNYKFDNEKNGIWRDKKTVLTYYKPFDIIIGSCSYDTDYKSYELLTTFQNELKSKIAEQKIGQNGYVFVINSNGEYIVSKDRLRDGENILKKNSSNNPTRAIIDGTKKSSNNFTYYYKWKNISGKKALQKVAVCTYIPQWDWIICAGAYENDFLKSLTAVKIYISAICTGSILIGSLVAYIIAAKIFRPLKKLEKISLAAADGNLNIAVDTKITAQKDEIGNLARCFDIMIQNLKNKLLQLSISKQKFQQVAENAVELLWEIDAEGRYTYVNNVCEKILGYTPQEIIGKYYYDLIPETEREKLKKTTNKIIKRKNSFKNLINQALTKDNQLIWLSTSGVPLLDENGELLGYTGSDVDITERVLAEKKQTEKFDRIQRQQSAIYKISVEPALAAGEINQALKVITKTSADALDISEVSIWIFNKEKNELECNCCYHKATKQYLKGMVLKSKKYPKYFQQIKNGELLAVSDCSKDERMQEFQDDCLVPLNVKSIMDTGIKVAGDIVGAISCKNAGEIHSWNPDEIDFVQKIGYQTAQVLINKQRRLDQLAMQQLNNRLEKTNSELQNFIQIATHDLREPLRKVTAFGTLLKKSLPEKLNSDEKENLDFVIQGADKMNQMVNGLLAYSKITPTSEPMQKTNINNIIENLKDFELAADIKNGKIKLSIQPNIEEVAAHPSQVRLLLANIIANAVKYKKTNTAAEISITAKPAANNMLKIEIADNGIGIAPEYHQTIFGMFRRLHSQDEYEGTGIGLAICKKIIETHRGKIGVESFPQKGAKFWFTLPSAENYEKDVPQTEQIYPAAKNS